jgi:carbon monoxide dehydrogenase subunit G
MEVRIDKRYPLAVTPAQAWAVLADVRATAACMPGAQITEQLDATHYKGTVRSKVGPATMTFQGDIEVLGIDPAARQLQMVGKGADRGGSSASMTLTAQVEDGATPDSAVLVGQAVVVVSGKLAQFGSRLIQPVSEAMLAQFADHFRFAAAAVPPAGAPSPAGEGVVDPTPASDAAGAAVMAQAEAALAAPAGGSAPAGPDFLDAPASAAPALAAAAVAPPVAAPVPTPATTTARAASPLPAPAPVRELNALALLWLVVKGWLAGLFGGKPR